MSFFSLLNCTQSYECLQQMSHQTDDDDVELPKLMFRSDSRPTRTLYDLENWIMVFIVAEIDHIKVPTGNFWVFFAGSNSTFASRARTGLWLDFYRSYSCFLDFSN